MYYTKDVKMSNHFRHLLHRVITTTERVSRRSRSNQQKYISSNVGQIKDSVEMEDKTEIKMYHQKLSTIFCYCRCLVQKEQHGFSTSLGVFNHKTYR